MNGALDSREVLGRDPLRHDHAPGLRDQLGHLGLVEGGEEGAPPPLAPQENRDLRRVRNYPEQPPTIPHKIEGYQIDVNANRCLSCHSRTATGTSRALPKPKPTLQAPSPTTVADPESPRAGGRPWAWSLTLEYRPSDLVLLTRSEQCPTSPP